MPRAIRCLTAGLVASLALAAPASAASELPARCSPAKMAEMIRLAERVCPLRPTSHAQEFLAWVNREHNDPACFDAARRYVAEQRRSMQHGWCKAAEYIVNSDPDPNKKWLVPR
jgi:hypothetical protein